MNIVIKTVFIKKNTQPQKVLWPHFWVTHLGYNTVSLREQNQKCCDRRRRRKAQGKPVWPCWHHRYKTLQFGRTSEGIWVYTRLLWKKSVVSQLYTLKSLLQNSRLTAVVDKFRWSHLCLKTLTGFQQCCGRHCAFLFPFLCPYWWCSSAATPVAQACCVTIREILPYKKPLRECWACLDPPTYSKWRDIVNFNTSEI